MQTRGVRDAPARAARDRGRMARTSITIVLELDDVADSPRGHACLADGTSREFHGWLALAEAIESLARTGATLGSGDTSNGEETS